MMTKDEALQMCPTPPAAQPEQRPVDNDFFKSLANSPDQRPWVGLTQKEVQEIHDTYYKRMGPQEFASMIEAALRSKNT